MPIRPAGLIRGAAAAVVIGCLLSFPVPAQDAAGREFRFVADGAVVGRPVVTDDGTVFCATDGGSLVRIAADGSLRWIRHTGGRPRFLLRKNDGTLVAVLSGGGFEAYNPRGGLIARSAAPRTGEEPTAVFETPEGRLLFAYADGGFTVTTTEGRRLLSWTAPGPLSCPPAVNAEYLACGTEGGEFLVYRLSGRLVRRAGGESPASALAWTGDNGLAAARRDGSFEVSGENGERVFEKALPFQADRILPAGDGFFLLGGEGGIMGLSGGELVVLGGRDVRAAGGVVNSRGDLFAALAKGGINAYDSSGSPIWTTSLTGRPGAPALSANERFLAVGGEDWVVNLFEFVGYGTGEAGEAAGAKARLPRTIPAPTLREEYRNDYDFLYLINGAASPRAVRKRESVEDLEARFAAGNFGRSLPYASEVLRYIAAEPYRKNRAQNLPDIRLRAVELLGGMGSESDAEFLAELLAEERDEAVIPGILAALGDLGSDADEKIRRSLVRFLGRGGELPPHGAADSVVGALEKIALYHGDIGGEGAAAFGLLLTGEYPASLRARISRFLRDLPSGF